MGFDRPGEIFYNVYQTLVWENWQCPFSFGGRKEKKNYEGKDRENFFILLFFYID